MLVQSGAFFFFQVLIRISICKTIYNLIVLSLKRNKNVHNCALFLRLLQRYTNYWTGLHYQTWRKMGLKWKFFQKKIPKSSYPDGAACCLAKKFSKNVEFISMYLRFQPMEHYDDVNANFKKKNPRKSEWYCNWQKKKTEK